MATSGVAVFVLVFGITIGTGKMNNKEIMSENSKIFDMKEEKQNNEESLKKEDLKEEGLQDQKLKSDSQKKESSEDKSTNVKEELNENAREINLDYYAGKYVDNDGNNVILLVEDNANNRKEICSKFGITENNTIFKKAKYSYKYLTDLQSKISEKMISKEFNFIIKSALMEDSNNIKVTVTSNNEEEINRLKALDTIGGALNIEFGTNNAAKEDLLIER